MVAPATMTRSTAARSGGIITQGEREKKRRPSIQHLLEVAEQRKAMKLHIVPVAQFNTRWIHVVHSDVEEAWCEDVLTLEAAPVQAYLLTKQDSLRPPIGLFLTTGLVPD